MKKTNATNFRQTPPKNQFSPKLSSFEDTVRNTHLPFHPRKWDAAIGARFEIQRGAYTLDRTPNKYTPRRSFIPRRDSQGIGSLVTRFSSSFFFFLFLFLFLFFAFLQGREFSTRDSKKGSLCTRTRREASSGGIALVGHMAMASTRLAWISRCQGRITRDPRVERTRSLFSAELPTESTASRALDRLYLPVLTWPQWIRTSQMMRRRPIPSGFLAIAACFDSLNDSFFF